MNNKTQDDADNAVQYLDRYRYFGAILTASFPNVKK
jgi:hypothetical protein